ncbi:DUF4427 domain-containing protein [Pseudomonas sp. CC120222-01a]|uniref:DUF4427 domain-containing protein n=1 Tax=Pseudomonas sp. CC120222-01a TaxID=1378075 RepID=UPI0021151277|nr:DUF4427 domain-containing protein [Pseudomonas sp. CC120222-01a]
MNLAATRYAITIPTSIAESAGAQHVAYLMQGRTYLHDGSVLPEQDIVDNQFRLVVLAENSANQPSEWRWPYLKDYRRATTRIVAKGLSCAAIPGLDITEKSMSGIGVVVPDVAAAREVQYDLICLIDQGIVSEAHFEYVLVCDQLPECLYGLSDEEIGGALSRATFDYKSCMTVAATVAAEALRDFSSRLANLESSTPRNEIRENGGCWLSFQDNTHPYVRALVAVGRVKVNKLGRYLASLDELDPGRDLRERQQIARALALQLEDEIGVTACYFSVLNSQSPDEHPFYAGRLGAGSYCITDAKYSDDED